MQRCRERVASESVDRSIRTDEVQRVVESNPVRDAATLIEVEKRRAAAQQDVLAVVNPFGVRVGWF